MEIVEVKEESADEQGPAEGLVGTEIAAGTILHTYVSMVQAHGVSFEREFL